jgi:hypothetical protein
VPAASMGPAGPNGPAGANGARGPAGPPGRPGSGPRSRSRAEVLLAIAAYQASASRRRVVVRFILTRPATVVLLLSRGAHRRPVVLAHARGRKGRGLIVWNGRTGPRRLAPGLYRVLVRATAAGHTATSSLIVRLR